MHPGPTVVGQQCSRCLQLLLHQPVCGTAWVLIWIAHCCLLACRAADRPQGADPTARDGENRTPLHHAVMRGHVDVVDVLLERGGPALLLAKDILGCTPVHLAAVQNQVGPWNQPAGCVMRRRPCSSLAGVAMQVLCGNTTVVSAKRACLAHAETWCQQLGCGRSSHLSSVRLLSESGCLSAYGTFSYLHRHLCLYLGSGHADHPAGGGSAG